MKFICSAIIVLFHNLEMMWCVHFKDRFLFKDKFWKTSALRIFWLCVVFYFIFRVTKTSSGLRHCISTELKGKSWVVQLEKSQKTLSQNQNFGWERESHRLSSMFIWTDDLRVWRRKNEESGWKVKEMKVGISCSVIWFHSSRCVRGWVEFRRIKCYD